jgi:hypothetical protein
MTDTTQELFTTEDTLIAELRQALIQHRGPAWSLRYMNVYGDKEGEQTPEQDAPRSYAISEFFSQDDQTIGVSCAWYTGERILVSDLELEQALPEHAGRSWHFVPYSLSVMLLKHIGEGSSIACEWVESGQMHKALWLAGELSSYRLMYSAVRRESLTHNAVIHYDKIVHQVSSPTFAYVFDGKPYSYNEGDILVFCYQ